jgi:hypothetical protein
LTPRLCSLIDGPEVEHGAHFLILYYPSVSTPAQPQYVVMYDPELAFLRELEVFNASVTTAAAPLSVFFLVYDTSLEEQKYLSALTREKVRPLR